MSQPDPLGWTLGRPRLAWDADDTPRSLAFDDHYAARADALAEARHVVLDGLGAPALWTRPGAVVIGETGFGLGVNFLAAWDLWRRTAPGGARLHWLSLEGFPVTREEATRVLSRFPALKDLATRLLAAWPPAIPGLHVLALDDRVTLTLALGHAEQVLPALSAQVDAWVLDGFAPARNPDMWSPAVLAHVARLSRPGTRLTTFTAAGAVRRGLDDVGFAVSREPGFGTKRDASRATFRGPRPAGAPAFAPGWRGNTRPLTAGARVTVIGAGIAGCALAGALRRRGDLAVTVIDRRGHPAEALPPRLLGLMEPRFDRDPSTADRLHAAALLAAVPRYDALARAGIDPWRGPRGVLSPDRGRRDAAWRRAVVDRLGWPEDWLRLVDEREASDLAGAPAPGDALWHPRGGCLAPAILLPALLGDTPVVPATVTALEPGGRGWRLLDSRGAAITESDAVVLATASETPALWPAASLPLRPTRGQASLLRAEGPGATPRVAVSSGAYVTPAAQDEDGWWRLLGATQTPWRSVERDGDPFTPRDGDDARIRANLAAEWPALAETLAGEATVMALAGLRATTPDHLPLAGPLFDAAALAASHGEALRKGGHAARAIAPMGWTEGLWCLTGLGSRGLLTAPLMAEVVAAGLTGTPAALPTDLLAAVHPARFAIRALIRGQPIG